METKSPLWTCNVPHTMCKNKRIHIIRKATRNSQYISNYCYRDKNNTFHNYFLKRVKDDILVIDNLNLCQINGIL